MARTLAHARLWLVMALIGGGMAVADDAKHTLRYRFTPGETVYFTSRNETKRTFMVNSHTDNARDSVDAVKHYRVLSVTPDGSAILELMIDRTTMTVDNGSSLFIYDSTKDKDPPAAFLPVQATVGRPWLHVTVTPLGETTKYETPAGMPVPQSPDFVSRVLPVVPEQPIAIGEIWKEPCTIDVTVEDGGEVAPDKPLTRPIRMQRVYKLKSVENGIAVLDLRTEVLTAKRTPKEEVQIIQRQFKGTITIDVANGRLLGRDLTIDGNVLGYDGPMSAMQVKMAQKDAYVPSASSAIAPEASVTK